MSVRLFIGNLPYAATEAELREHLSGVGQPSQIVLPVDRETGRPRGFAFVDYADRGVAEEAIRRYHQQPFKGRPLAVSEAGPARIVRRARVLAGIRRTASAWPEWLCTTSERRWVHAPRGGCRSGRSNGPQ